jgi:hypothetical protein
VSIDPHFERSVLAEFRLRERRARRRDELAAVELFDAPLAQRHFVLGRARALSNAPGRRGQLARVVARASIEDRLDGTPPARDSLSALRLLPDPGLVG